MRASTLALLVPHQWTHAFFVLQGNFPQQLELYRWKRAICVLQAPTRLPLVQRRVLIVFTVQLASSLLWLVQIQYQLAGLVHLANTQRETVLGEKQIVFVCRVLLVRTLA